MKKTFLKTFSILLCFVVFSLLTFTSLNAQEIRDQIPDEDKILQSRFTNMLNNNYVYGEDFEDLERVVNCSTVALLEYRVGEDEAYIPENIINSYLYDMYGFRVDDFSGINAQFDKKEGYVFVLPKGYSVSTHSVTGIKENADGTYLCTSNVKTATHDGTENSLTAETLFVKNPDSAFGYNIVYSTLIN